MKCENCGKEHNGSYGSGRFCSKECARAFSTKNSQGQLKEAKCIDCGKIIYIGKRASNNKCRCEECNKKHFDILHHKKIKKVKEKQIKYCKICGAEIGKCKHPEICKKYRIFNSLIIFGLDKSKLGTENIFNEFNKIKNIIKYEYQVNRITDNELKEKYNYTSGLSNFHKIIHSLNINSISCKDAVKLSYENGRKNSPGYGYFHDELHISWEGNEYHLRSSYELDYANELDNKHIHYNYENLRIKYFDTQLKEFRIYIPDFYLIDTNTIVEIKSEFTIDYQNIKDKKKACIEQGYNFILYLEHKIKEI